MSNCYPYPSAIPLNYCGSAGDPAILHIGILEEDREADQYSVLMRDLGSGRITVHDLTGDDMAIVAIEHPADLSPGTTYEVKVVAVNDTSGIAPVPFFPYLYEGGTFISAYSTVDGVNIKFQKMFDADGVHGHAEQFVTLA
ncbi:MAG TPA: fibronectin type III domain-containing protein [Flavobacteriales bacterium]|nr:fibronectin type III domain-containing protein [Flavobacteriales bacterium]HNU56671.1 fibronectin type III domain-containing protein [Flavobacteriales bacterium]